MFMPSPSAFRLDPALALAPLRPVPRLRPVDCGMASDALVETEAGWARASEVAPGMRIATFDGGFAPVTGVRRRGADGTAQRAIFIPPGALGNCEGLTVAAGQEILLPSGAAETLLDAAFALVPAEALRGYFGIAAAAAPDAGYLSFDFAAEEVVWANSGLLLACPTRQSGAFLRLSGPRAHALVGLLAEGTPFPETQDAALPASALAASALAA